LLFRTAKYPASVDAYAKVTDPSLVANATFQRGRALFRAGRASEGTAAFQKVLTQYANDTVAAAGALYSLADAAADDGDDRQARATFQRLATTYPSAEQASMAAYRAGLLALFGGDPNTAARELTAVTQK